MHCFFLGPNPKHRCLREHRPSIHPSIHRNYYNFHPVKPALFSLSPEWFSIPFLIFTSIFFAFSLENFTQAPSVVPVTNIRCDLISWEKIFSAYEYAFSCLNFSQGEVLQILLKKTCSLVSMQKAREKLSSAG